MSNKSLLKWALLGDVGQSSRAMAIVAADLDGSDTEDDYFDYTAHPYDPSDFNRCLQLIKEAPEVKDSFHRIAELSPQWNALIQHWDEIEAMFIEEVGENWHDRQKPATKTYNFMREIYENI